MSDYRTYITQTGFGLERDAKFNNTQVGLAVLVVGDGVLPDAASPAERTDLIHQVREYGITIEKDEKDPNVWIARAEIPASDGGFFIKEAGIKTTDGELYSYARQAGDYKPLLEEGQGKSYTIRLKFVPGNADAIQIKIDPSVQFVTPTDLGNALTAHLDAEDPHPQYKTYADQKAAAHVESEDPHGQYLGKLENAEQLNALKQIPIYPEVMTDDNRLSVTLDGANLSIDNDQVIRLFGWLDVNTSSYQDKSFVIDLTKTYHLRFDLDNGFRLLDLADIVYNPDQLDHFNELFDATYSDVLTAVIRPGGVTSYINVSSILSGQIAYLETNESYSLANNIVFLTLSYSNEFSRSFNMRSSGRLVVSAPSGANYGILSFFLNGVPIRKTRRIHVGIADGYVYMEDVELWHSSLMLRTHYDLEVAFKVEAGVVYLNSAAANSGWTNEEIAQLSMEVV
jgi:hypothetical protein